jgi:hypothetical protein
MALPRLRRLRLRGRFGPGAEPLVQELDGVEVEFVAKPAEPPARAVGRVPYRALRDGTWAIVAEVSSALAADTNLDAEAAVRAAIRDESLELLSRLRFDSEADALIVVASSEDDIRRAASVVDSLTA